jgi:hypothetical protein
MNVKNNAADEISIVDTGNKKIIVRMPHDMLILSSWHAKWKFRFSGKSQESFPVKMPDGQILLDRNPARLICTPGSTPMCYITFRVLDHDATRNSRSHRSTDEMIVACGIDGMAFICDLMGSHADTKELVPKSDEFKIADIIGQESFERVTNQMRSFIARERQ